MAKVVELIEALHARGATSEPPLEDELDRSNRQPSHSNHPEVRAGENNSSFPKEEALLERV